MFGLFGKKPREKPPERLVFKSNAAAFEYACKFLITTLENENQVLAIVLGSVGDRVCVKLSNSLDDSVPAEEPQALLDQGEIENICFSAAKVDRVSRLRKGDLVIYMAPKEIAAAGFAATAGLIIAKVQPVYDLKRCGWVIAPG